MAAGRTIPRSRQTRSAVPPASPDPRRFPASTSSPSSSSRVAAPIDQQLSNGVASKAPAASEKRDGSKNAEIAKAVVQTTASEWLMVLGLIFGGCCSNAWALELSTNQLPSSGTLITFAQFLTTTLSCLPSHLYLPSGSWLPRLRPRAVPLSRWIVQVALYFSTSLINNMAFAYDIPMPVHIVFRSGGLVVNMVLGYCVQKRSYTPLQVLSVLLVTAGVISSTLYSSSATSSDADPTAVSNYLTGVLLLFSALVLTGLMGLWQERTFKQYGTSNWRESLFYSHLLSLPMFLFRAPKLSSEIALANATDPWWLGWRPRSRSLSPPLKLTPFRPTPNPRRFDLSLPLSRFLPIPPTSLDGKGLTVPSFYPPLVLNVLTQLLCINGVNRLTSKVSSLSVTLVLVVRKALSLVVSVMVVSGGSGNAGLWMGAMAVLLGTVGYSMAGSATSKGGKKPKRS